jgi:uncharacterized oxidoreductase
LTGTARTSVIRLPAAEIRDLGTRLFDALNSPHEESAWVAETLVNSSLRGYNGHGIMRIPQYVRYLQAGDVAPGAPFEILKQTPTMAIADAHRGWGQVAARRAMELAIAKARTHAVGTVVVRNSQHVSRLGEYPAMAAPHGMIGLAVINLYGGKEVEEVAPWGGIDPKLAPNPLAWAAPSGEEWPLCLDMTTSVIPEGKVRLARYHGADRVSGRRRERGGHLRGGRSRYRLYWDGRSFSVAGNPGADGRPAPSGRSGARCRSCRRCREDPRRPLRERRLGARLGEPRGSAGLLRR